MQSILIASFAAVASAQSLNIIPYKGSVDLGGCTNSAIHAGTAIHFDGGMCHYYSFDSLLFYLILYYIEPSSSKIPLLFLQARQLLMLEILMYHQEKSSMVNIF